MGPSGLIYKHPLRERYVLSALLRAGKVTAAERAHGGDHSSALSLPQTTA